MSGFFGVASKESCLFDLYFGTDYHSHLGTRRAGMATYGSQGFTKSIHNIENSPFRTKFENDLNELEGTMGIGCISDYEPQPIVIRSIHGTYAITTVSKINNTQEIIENVLQHRTHFFEMSNGEVNATELVAALINQKDNLIEGIQYALDTIDGSLSLLLMTPKGIYAARDKHGRTPVILGKKDDARCVTFESFAFLNLGYELDRELGPGEIVCFDDHSCQTLVQPGSDMKICTFLWVYYGYPSATYEGVNVEEMRYNCGKLLARRDAGLQVDVVAGVPDSGTAHAVGYANEIGIPFSRPFIKYTPTWPRSFMPTIQTKRNLIAKMKLIPVHELIQGKKLLLIDDSIVRGTQLRETTEFLYESGAKEVHIRPACPPLLFGCKYLNFSRSTSEHELIARRVIEELEGQENVPMEVLQEYADPDSEKYQKMVDKICEKLNFTSLRYHRLDDMLDSVGLDHCKMCTYCWNGKE
ncbi:amidophosphoribosyltransferase [Floccifex sp.]|uniref:amidophosphoribosyltransferase n=1 Tax=Floccifex sp. TaxID=2815810 RepID=UPI002A7515BD|nr:phosphoribosyltransferase family protein [Floccifex sp.]MDD7281132.1 amidophosphoribosyltransferase [Erysipelotrichaceae bacterium]MDY2957797.1 amidophosphoribosyltransferase [Floccifex sp.]